MNFSKFFSNVQEAPWYQNFLTPVVDVVETRSSLLDIGTGPGKLIEKLFLEKQVKCVGTDTSEGMLEEARQKLSGIDCELIKVEAGQSLPFLENTFDYVSFCNVLFNLTKAQCNFLLGEANRVLKRDGKIIVLSPTGRGGYGKITNKYYSVKNFSMVIWYTATKSNALNWEQNQWLREYAKKQGLTYRSQTVFDGFAQLVIIT